MLITQKLLFKYKLARMKVREDYGCEELEKKWC